MSASERLDPVTSIPTFRIDGTDLDPDAALVSFRTAVKDVFSVEPPERCDPRAGIVDAVSWHLGKMMLGVFRGPPLKFQRSVALLASSGLSHILVQLYMEGGFAGVAGPRPILVQPGDICIFDLTQTLETQTSAFTNVSMLFPREDLSSFFSHPVHLHGTVLARGEPLTDILREYILSLAERVSLLSLRQAMLAAGPTVALVGSVLAGQSLRADEDPPRGQNFDLRKVADYVDARTGDPQLDAAQIAKALGVSRAALYRVCAHSGGVATLIRWRRLSGAALHLADPLQHARISEVVRRWGFASDSAFARTFREAFGISPREARQRGTAPVSTGTDGSVDAQGFANWLRLLRTTGLSTTA